MKDKRGTQEINVFVFFQNYLRDTGIDFEFVCSAARTQTFKRKKNRVKLVGKPGISIFWGTKIDMGRWWNGIRNVLE